MVAMTYRLPGDRRHIAEDSDMRRSLRMTIGLAAVSACLLAAPAGAHFQRCPEDSVKAGDVCMDTYEASVWRVPDPTGRNRKLVKKIQKGRIQAVTDLTSRGAVQLGVGCHRPPCYPPCTEKGASCTDVFAVSLPGVIPSSAITWFQAQQACANAGKHLPTSAEWQQAVAGSPDPGGDNETTDCNTTSVTAMLPEDPVPTGSRSSCVSSFGAFDMVGNLYEWTADWVPRSTAGPGWGAFSDDDMFLSGAAVTAPGPGALVRGGGYENGAGAGPLWVSAGIEPSFVFDVGFRCAR